MSNQTKQDELFDLCKQVYKETGWDNKASTSYSERLRVWQRGYSISEMGEANDDYGMTPPDERNKVNVYDWEVKEDQRHRITTGQEVFNWWYPEVKTIENNVYPLYTSDYLLERLPKKITTFYGKAYPLSPQVMAAGEYFYAMYKHDMTGPNSTEVVLEQEAESPLKALLKLTLALSEAGEL